MKPYEANIANSSTSTTVDNTTNTNINTNNNSSNNNESESLSVGNLQLSENIVKPYSVYILVTLKQLDLSSDLGQAIGKVNFNSNNIQMRTKNMPGKLKKFTVSTDILDINC